MIYLCSEISTVDHDVGVEGLDDLDHDLSDVLSASRIQQYDSVS